MKNCLKKCTVNYNFLARLAFYVDTLSVADYSRLFFDLL